MVLIFGGIDFPVFEVILVVSVVFFVGVIIMVISLYYIFKEIKGLKYLLKQEERDVQKLEQNLVKEETEIKRFEQDIQKFESSHPDAQGSNMELKRYIVSNLNKGVPWEQIKIVLVQQGYTLAFLDKVYAEMKPVKKV